MDYFHEEYVQFVYLLLLSYWRNSLQKEGIFILLINKQEAHRLHNDYNVPFKENGISMTGRLNGRHKYYLCENTYNMECLQKIRHKKVGE